MFRIVVTDANSIITKIIEPLNSKLSGVLSWINGEEGRLLVRTAAGLGSFVVGDPTGMLFPTILECSDIVIRKKVLKHFPELVDRLHGKETQLNMDFIKTDFGQQLLRETLRSITKEDHIVKIEMLKSFLVSTYTEKTHDNEVIRSYFRLLQQMDFSHFRILSVFNDPEPRMNTIITCKLQELKFHLDSINDLNKYIFKFNYSLYQKSLSELDLWKITKDANVSSTVGDITKEDHEKLILAQTDFYKQKITDYGKGFMKLIEENDAEEIYQKSISSPS